jgi:hypothetical protein
MQIRSRSSRVAGLIVTGKKENRPRVHHRYGLCRGNIGVRCAASTARAANDCAHRHARR